MQVRGVAGRPFGVGSSTTTFRSVWHTTVNELLFMVVELLQMYDCCAQTGAVICYAVNETCCVIKDIKTELLNKSQEVSIVGRTAIHYNILTSRSAKRIMDSVV